MNKGLNKEETEQLYRAILSLETPEECEAFFEDLCTIQEIKSMAQRVQVAKMLSEGILYKNIVDSTGASTATISRINRALLYGADGYKRVFERMLKK